MKVLSENVASKLSCQNGIVSNKKVLISLILCLFALYIELCIRTGHFTAAQIDIPVFNGMSQLNSTDCCGDLKNCNALLLVLLLFCRALCCLHVES